MSHYPLRKKQELSLTCRLLSSTYSFFFGFSSWSRVIIWVLFPVMFWLFLVNASKKLGIANWIFCFLQRSPLIRRRKGRKIWSEQGGFYDALSRNELANSMVSSKVLHIMLIKLSITNAFQETQISKWVNLICSSFRQMPLPN